MFTDNYSNYSLSSLFKCCNKGQRLLILMTISDQISDIAQNKKGTHCLQNFLELMDCNEELDLVLKSISPRIIELCKVRLSLLHFSNLILQHKLAYHFMQKLLQKLPKDLLKLVYGRIAEKFISLSRHCYGMPIIKEIM